MELIGDCGCQKCCGVNKEGHDDWGLCPYCGKTDGCHSVGPDHWYVCHEHKTKWWIGSNLFSTWRHLTEEEQRRDRRIFDEYRTVAPIMCGDELRDAVSEAADPWSDFSRRRQHERAQPKWPGQEGAGTGRDDELCPF